MRQRFCNVPQDSSSSHLQWILNPPVHFSNSTLQRGTTHQLPAGPPAGKPPVCHCCAGPVDGEPKEENRSISTALDMKNSFQIGGKRERRSGFSTGRKNIRRYFPASESMAPLLVHPVCGAE